MKDRFIFVSWDKSANALKLSDEYGNSAEELPVSAKDHIIWILDKSSGLLSLDKIEKKKGANVLKSNPVKIRSILYGGVVSHSPGIGEDEDYTIHYTKVNSESGSIDPKLKMDD